MDDKLNKDAQQELSAEEMENAAGGDIFDKIECLFRGHTWEQEAEQSRSLPNRSGDERVGRYHCIRCGKKRYTKYNFISWTKVGETEISEDEYNAF